jgi:hypothetical protein
LIDVVFLREASDDMLFVLIDSDLEPRRHANVKDARSIGEDVETAQKQTATLPWRDSDPSVARLRARSLRMTVKDADAPAGYFSF